MHKDSRKAKLKTLPNELSTSDPSIFQTTSHQQCPLRLNLASPTFATSDQRADTGAQGGLLKERRRAQLKQCSEGLLMEENRRLLQKCKELEYEKKGLESQNKRLSDNLEACKKSLLKKVEKVAQYMLMKNSCQEQTNIDIYLEWQVVRKDYKEKTEQNEILASSNTQLKEELEKLKLILQNYTKKSEMKQKDKKSFENLEREHRQQVEEAKRGHEILVKKLENEKKERQKQIKKIKEEYDKLKFLKEEIQKKRQEELHSREESEAKLHELSKQAYAFKEKNAALQQKNASLQQKNAALQQKNAHLTAQHEHWKLQLQRQNSADDQFKQQRLQNQRLKLELQSAHFQLDRVKREVREEEVRRRAEKEEIKKLQSAVVGFQEEGKQMKIIKGEMERRENEMSMRISELQKEVNETESELTQIKAQFDDWMTSHQEQLRQQREQLQHQLKGQLQAIEKELEQTKQIKALLERDLENERQRSERISSELEKTSRRMQEHHEGRDIARRTQISDSLPRQRALPTKTISQLKMVESILARILGNEDFDGNKFKANSIGKEQLAEFLVGEISKEAEQIADVFDSLETEVEGLRGQVRNKQEVISKLLRFTPEVKKVQILEYLNVMENIQGFPTEHIYKATRDIEEEANDWKRQLNQLSLNFEKSQEQLASLRKMCKVREPLRQYPHQERYPQKWSRSKYNQF